MKLFRRAMRIFFLVFGFVVGLLTAVAAYMARLMIAPPRQRIWAKPSDLHLDYESIHFPAQDGLRLAGWFIPSAEESLRKGATIVLVHGWPWNRLGEAAESPLAMLDGSSPVNLLRLAYALHRDGFNVFMFDLRNHGESAASSPVTFGVQEAKDLLGAIEYINGRSDVDPERIGVVGFSMGANTLLYSLPHTSSIKAGIAVQPTSPRVFAEGYSAYLLGPIAPLVMALAEKIYQMAGGVTLDAIRPGSAASSANNVPILYVQGRGDTWGSSVDVQQMANMTPEASSPLLVDAAHRFDGYQYVVDNPKVVTAFFEQHLPE